MIGIHGDTWEYIYDRNNFSSSLFSSFSVDNNVVAPHKMLVFLVVSRREYVLTDLWEPS